MCLKNLIINTEFWYEKWLKFSRLTKQLITMDKIDFNTLSANPTKWSNTLKQFVTKLLTISLRVFDHFLGLAFKGLKEISMETLLKYLRALKGFHKKLLQI